MPDDKRGRDKQARDADRRQRKRDIAAELERMDESEPPIDASELALFEAELDSVAFPATGAEVVAAVGDREIESAEGTYAVEELVPAVDWETFDSPIAVRKRIQRPTVAAAMTRVTEAAEPLQNVDLRGSQRDAYEKTFRELEAIDADDDDEGVQFVADWILERIRDADELPGSRAVRRKASSFCRERGYDVRNDEWLGI